MGVVAAGRVHCAPRSPGGDHLRQQRRLGQSALQHDLQGRRERRPPERHRTLCRDRPDGGVHRDQSGGRQVPLRQQRHRRHLEDGRACPRGRRRGRAAVQAVELPRRRRVHAVRLSRRLRRVDRRRRVRAARLRTGGPSRRRGARSQARSVSRDSRRHGDRRRALCAVAGRDDRRARPRAPRQGLVDAARRRSVRLRRLVHARARAGSGVARQGAPHRRGHLTGGDGRRLPGDHGPTLVRPRRRARDADRAGDDQEGRAGRLHSHGGCSSAWWRSDRSRAGIPWSAS